MRQNNRECELFFFQVKNRYKQGWKSGFSIDCFLRTMRRLVAQSAEQRQCLATVVKVDSKREKKTYETYKWEAVDWKKLQG